MNKLDQATSVFLRQHKDNPVAWRLWGPEVMAEAESTGKPIFLSIGYTACHWCHALNTEIFSDPIEAQLINDNFIPVLVDREERPDLDQIYQAAAQLMGHGGGWPLNCILTAQGLPFAATGFLPREERMGQPAFRKVVAEIVGLVRENPLQVMQTSATVLQQLNDVANRDMRGPIESVPLDAASLRTGQRFDIFLGGLIGERKFPQATLMEVLWRAYLRSGASQFFQLFATSMDSILLGGLYDHVGGGFFRYTNDERWQVPHFEKMLYDSAQLVELMTGLWQHNRNAMVRDRITRTIDWMLREMRQGDAFAAALDADSEGEEGKFYLWSEAEIDAALAGTFSARFKQVYGVSRDGNMGGKNILRRNSQVTGLSEADEALLSRQRDLLLAARDKRVRPQRDDKILTDWNGLAIAAIAQAGAALERPDWLQAATTAYDHVKKISSEGETLYHSWADGQHGQAGFSDDYAQMARAALLLWEITGDNRYLDDAKAWTRTLNTQFWDEIRGGYNFVGNNADPLIVRLRMIHDAPTPSTNATMIKVLTRLMLITGEGEHAGRAQALVTVFVDEMNRNFVNCGEMFNGFETLANGLQIVVIGPRNNARTQEFIHAVWGRALPNRLLVVVDSDDALPEGHPVKGKGMPNGQPCVYVCQRNNCSPAITSAVTLSQALTLPQQAQQQQQQRAN